MYKFKPDRSAVELPAHKLVFFCSPKTASSSVKKMLYEVFHDKPFKDHHPDGSKYMIHKDFSPTPRFLEIPEGKYDGWTKITLVRDPVERIISAYCNRVLDLNIISPKHIEQNQMDKYGLEYQPPMHKFMRNIEKYRMVSRPVWHHTDRLTSFLGHDLGYFDKVFKFGEFDKMVGYISEHTGHEAKLPASTNRSKSKRSFESLGENAKQSLLNYCAGDYALLKSYYSPPSI